MCKHFYFRAFIIKTFYTYKLEVRFNEESINKVLFKSFSSASYIERTICAYSFSEALLVIENARGVVGMRKGAKGVNQPR